MQKYFFQILPPFFQLPLHHLRYPNPKYLKSVFFLIFSDSHVLDIGDYVPAKKKEGSFLSLPSPSPHPASPRIPMFSISEITKHTKFSKFINFNNIKTFSTV